MMGTYTKGWQLLTSLQTHICNIPTPPPIIPANALEQRVEQRVCLKQLRVIDNKPIVPIQRIFRRPGDHGVTQPNSKTVVESDSVRPSMTEA